MYAIFASRDELSDDFLAVTFDAVGPISANVYNAWDEFQRENNTRVGA